MAHESKEIVIPDYTFGINQVFGAAFDSGLRTFPGHYLLYASTGAFRLEVGNARWLLPPQRAAWVAANTPLRLSAKAPGTTSSVLFAEGSIQQLDFSCRVFSVSTLAREMLLYAVRWGPERGDHDPAADSFFRALATVCTELAAEPDELWLPCAESTELDRALEYTLANMVDKPTFAEVASAAHVSERTLARRFAEEAGMTWSEFARRARMIRAMELLAEPDSKVISVVDAVGFSSVSAFNHAFRAFTGETPSSYRKRLHPRL
jgi:AraC-like DNA-binding protein